ncbi:hypothetical protein [Chitinilyticum piscinae]|uniref:Uncharacterized protein n=1 Tax=Chitinilyticum piscinae TaxID=2866724 RepID=A0A8J7G1N8_9NEIS|nr:hypothetical protein [Chitinilyticum piscinae]MBE9610340.1 hypothetical protein [Chitinilyticum piscinae]
MSDIGSLRTFSVQVSQTLMQGAQQTMREVLDNADRLDRRKGNIAESALQRIQDNQAVAQKMAESRNKIDVFV